MLEIMSHIDKKQAGSRYKLTNFKQGLWEKKEYSDNFNIKLNHYLSICITYNFIFFLQTAKELRS